MTIKRGRVKEVRWVDSGSKTPGSPKLRNGGFYIAFYNSERDYKMASHDGPYASISDAEEAADKNFKEWRWSALYRRHPPLGSKFSKVR